MPTTPHDIVARFVDHQEPRVRQNCVVALGAFAEEGDAASLTTLLEMAAADANADVRRLAENALLKVDGRIPHRLGPELIAYHNRATVQSRPEALSKVSRLLGRLRARGISLVPTDPWFRRVWRLGSSRGLRWRVSIVPASLGAFVGYLVAVVLLSFRLDVSQVLTELFVASALLPVIVVPFAIRRQQPLLFEWDEPAVVARDVIESSGAVATVAWATASIVLTTTGHSFGDAFRFGGLMALVLALATALVHCGAAASARAWRRPVVRRVAQFTTALSAGVLTLTVAVMLLRALGYEDQFLRFQHLWIAEGFRVLAIPALAAIAAVLSALDASAEDVPSEFFTTARRVTSSAILLTVGLFVAAPYLHSYVKAEPAQVPTVVAPLSLSGESKSEEHRVGPERPLVPLQLDFAQRITADLDVRGFGEVRLELVEYAAGDGSATTCSPREVADTEYGPPIDRLLAPGCYALRVTQLDSNRAHNLETALATYSSMALRARETYALRLTLNADRTHVITQQQESEMQFPSSWTVTQLAGRTKQPAEVTVKLIEPMDIAVRQVHHGKEKDVELSLRHSDWDLQTGSGINKRLRPGTYVLRVLGDTLANHALYLTAEEYIPLQPPAGARRVDHRTAAQTLAIRRWPAVFLFEIPEPMEVIGTLSGRGAVDLVLSLSGQEGEIENEDTGEPEIISEHLMPGTYWFSADTYDRPDRVRSRGELGLQFVRRLPPRR